MEITMKTTTIMLSLLTACVAAGQMPTNATNRVSAPRAQYMSERTNLVSLSRAIEVASMLHNGMPLLDAFRFLERHGITIPGLDPRGTNNASYLADYADVTAARPFLQTTDFKLSGECSLTLLGWVEHLPGGPVTTRLDQALIKSNGVYTISITFTNRP